MATDSDSVQSNKTIDNEHTERYLKSQEYKDYEIEQHITSDFYPQRSKIRGFRHKIDIAICKDGEQYIAMIGNCLADALAIGFGNSELKALMSLVEDRTTKQSKPITSAEVYCVGILD